MKKISFYCMLTNAFIFVITWLIFIFYELIFEKTYAYIKLINLILV